MANSKMRDENFPDDVDPERKRGGNAFDTNDGYSGQDYDRSREEAEGRKNPSGHVSVSSAETPDQDSRDIPPDNGKRAYADPKTGEVHGSGAGAGGGNPGEDFDSDSASGDGCLRTGVKGEEKVDPSKS